MRARWTLEALKDYIDERFSQTERALDKAQEALEKRLDGMNEFRTQILEERSRFLSKDEYAQRHNVLEQRIETMEAKLETRLWVIERWQSKIVGALALFIFVTPLVVAITVWVFTKHHAP